MNPILYLSCVVLIIGSLAWTASAQEGDFESDRKRFLDIYSDPRLNEETSFMNSPFANDFLNKYIHLIKLTPELRARALRHLRILHEISKNIASTLYGGESHFPFRDSDLNTNSTQLYIDIASTGVKRRYENWYSS